MGARQDLDVVVCGGGRTGHLNAVLFKQVPGVRVSLLTTRQDVIAQHHASNESLTAFVPDAPPLRAHLDAVGSEASLAAQADLVVLTVPAHVRAPWLRRVVHALPRDKPVYVGAIPGFCGFDWLAEQILAERPNAVIWGMKDVPHTAFDLHPGVSVRMGGAKQVLHVGTHARETPEARAALQGLLQAPTLRRLTAVLLVIRAQPFDKRALRELLLPTDCASPCFMGIQPGVTKPQDAIDQLRSSDMVDRVGVSESLQTVAWFWKDNPSALLNKQEIPALFYDRNTVSSIRLYTTISLGDLLLELEPMGEQRIAMRRTIPFDTLKVELYYLANGYVLNAIVDCHNFWNQPTHLFLGARPSFINSLGRLAGSLNEAKHQIDITCRRLKEK